MTSQRSAYLRYLLLENLEGEPSQQTVAVLVLNRPAQANAFSGDLLDDIAELLDEVAAHAHVRLLLVQGEGKHFSAGADLNWMQEAARLDYEGNLTEAGKLTRMFESLSRLSIPTVALAKGAVFGGAVGLIAACDYAFAVEDSRFCLSETKIGLLPAVILPYLARKMVPAQLHRQVLSARLFSATEARDIGLVQAVYSAAEIEAKVREEIDALLAASPEAQASYKDLYRALGPLQWQQNPITAAVIAKTRASASGQAGLGAFFQKVSPPWALRVAKGEFICHL